MYFILASGDESIKHSKTLAYTWAIRAWRQRGGCHFMVFFWLQKLVKHSWRLPQFRLFPFFTVWHCSGMLSLIVRNLPYFELETRLVPDAMSQNFNNRFCLGMIRQLGELDVFCHKRSAGKNGVCHLFFVHQCMNYLIYVRIWTV